MKHPFKSFTYKAVWYIGVIFSFLLYFSGIMGVYLFFRKRFSRQHRTIILMYHRITDEVREPRYSVSTKNFERQMAYVKTHFNCISFAALVDDVPKPGKTDRDSIVITFDDGYKDNYLNAFPVVKQHELPATIFLVSRFIGNEQNILSIYEILAMARHGIDFGSHTLTHRALSELDDAEVYKEVYDSKSELEGLLDRRIRFFSYPYGKKRHFNEQIKAEVKKAGYYAAVTTENGGVNSRSDLYELKRIEIKDFPLFVFKVKVSGILENRLACFLLKWLKLC